MAKTKQQKQEILKNLNNKINQSKSIIFVKFDGLGVKENQDLRKQLKTENSEYYVVKKTLLNLAFKDIPNLMLKELNGQLAVVFGYADEIAPVKIIDKFKKNNQIDFAGAILENKFFSMQETQILAKLPSKQELYAKIVGSINLPISGLINAMAGNLRNLIYVLKNISHQK